MVPAEKKVKHLLSVDHTTKTIHHHHDNRLRVGERKECIVCQCDCKYLCQRLLLPTITIFLSLSDADFNHNLHQENLDVPIW